MRVINKYTAPLGLPGPSVALGGPEELAVGANDVEDSVWAEASKSAQVQAWIKSDLVTVEKKPKA